MKRELSNEVKAKWLSRMFYGVSNANDLNINPYDDLSQFLNSKVGSLTWGKNKSISKDKFCKKYQFLLELYGIKLSLKSIMAELNQESQVNKKAVEHWAELSEFPANW